MKISKILLSLSILISFLTLESCKKDDGEEILSNNKAITSFNILEKQATINEKNKTIALTIDANNLTELTPKIVVSSDATISPASEKTLDFTKPVTYTVTARDGSKVDYIVTVEKSKASDKKITSFKITDKEAMIDETNKTIILVTDQPNLTSLTPIIAVSNNATVSPASGIAQDFTNKVIYTVTAEDGSTVKYTATVTVTTMELPKSSKKEITNFSILKAGKGRTAVINEVDKTITLANYGTDLKALSPKISVSEGAMISPAPIKKLDFTNPVTYKVTAKDGSSTEYTVIITPTSNTNFTQYKDKEWAYSLFREAGTSSLKEFKIASYKDNGIDKTSDYSSYFIFTRFRRNNGVLGHPKGFEGINGSYLTKNEKERGAVFWTALRESPRPILNSIGAFESAMSPEDYMWFEFKGAKFFADDRMRAIEARYNVDKASTDTRIIMHSQDNTKVLILEKSSL